MSEEEDLAMVGKRRYRIAAQAVGDSKAGRRPGLEVFRSQPFPFAAAMAARTTAQSDGSELVSWQVNGGCNGGVYVPSCNPLARVRMKIAR